MNDVKLSDWKIMVKVEPCPSIDGQRDSIISEWNNLMRIITGFDHNETDEVCVILDKKIEYLR